MNPTLMFRATGWLLIASGSALFFSLVASAAGWLASLTTLLGDNPYTYYLAATGGSGLLGWGAVLLWSIYAPPEAQRLVAMGTGIGFLALGLMRVFASMAPIDEFDPLRFAMIGESFLFVGVSAAFFQLGCDFFGRLADAWRSLLSVKKWVVVWVFVFLAPINIASLVLYPLTHHPIALWTALSFAFVLLTNLPIALYERGISKATSIPHLIPWIPLVVYVSYWLATPESHGQSSAWMYTYAAVVFVVNGLSVAFDLLESYRWVKGDRATA